MAALSGGNVFALHDGAPCAASPSGGVHGAGVFASSACAHLRRAPARCRCFCRDGSTRM
jgi:hypothetical protein